VAKISERPLTLSRAAAINASRHELDEVEVRLQIESRANVALVAEAATGLIHADWSGEGLQVLDLVLAKPIGSGGPSGKQIIRITT